MWIRCELSLYQTFLRNERWGREAPEGEWSILRQDPGAGRKTSTYYTTLCAVQSSKYGLCSKFGYLHHQILASNNYKHNLFSLYCEEKCDVLDRLVKNCRTEQCFYRARAYKIKTLNRQSCSYNFGCFMARWWWTFFVFLLIQDQTYIHLEFGGMFLMLFYV